ncbi:hypothetical protein J7T55_015657 [Diaporthe amygdali]|uniref:uncharacterized protein n=1 Tax=Phomopsis amygdali TaxID=1214568 RepID=UPI0022FF03F1|nr:uncharacterized protein J7T55_015657 [Diaporthe amygdali]KAJ0120919.1 hypothetical protein J7T55_015657 [Diaporthe amygdali]
MGGSGLIPASFSGGQNNFNQSGAIPQGEGSGGINYSAYPNSAPNTGLQGVQPLTGYELPGHERPFRDAEANLLRMVNARAGSLIDFSNESGHTMDSIRKYIADQRLTWTPDQDRELRAVRVDELSDMSRVRQQLTLSGHRIDDEILARAKYLAGEEVARHSAQINNRRSTTLQQEWTEDESKILQQWVQAQCVHRWSYIQRQPKRPRERPFWTVEELRQLRNFAAGHDSWTENKDELKRSLPGRTTDACAARWHRLMKAWGAEEDAYLRSLTPQDSTDWWETVAGNRIIMEGRSIEELRFLNFCDTDSLHKRSLVVRRAPRSWALTTVFNEQIVQVANCDVEKPITEDLIEILHSDLRYNGHSLLPPLILRGARSTIFGGGIQDEWMTRTSPDIVLLATAAEFQLTSQK